MKLQFLEGRYRGGPVEIAGPQFVIGRDEDCDLTLDDDNASRRHARLEVSSGHCYVEDMQSTNGVRLNGTKISSRQRLHDGDKLGVGDHVFMFSEAKEEANQPPSPTPPRKRRPARPAAPPRRGIPAGLLWCGALAAVGAFVWLAVNGGSSGSDSAPPPAVPVVEHVADEAPAAGGGDAPGPPTDRQPAKQAAPAAPPEPIEIAAPADYIWLDTDPAGAEISVDGKVAGKAPLLVQQVATGAHAIRAAAPGYEPLTRTIEVPGEGALHRLTLRQHNGTLKVTSDPLGAAVVYGTQMLGRTPALIDSLSPGEHEVRLIEPGFTPHKQTVTIATDRPTAINVEMEPSTGSVVVTAMPAGAEILVDDKAKGVAEAVSPNSAKSKPHVVRGLSRGKHRVRLRYRGVRSAPQVATVEPARMTSVLVTLWFPDARVTKRSGEQVVGMLIEENELGDKVLALASGQHVRLLATEIGEFQKLPIEDTQALLKQLKKTREREQ
jgi:hypothetical protein